MADPSNSLFDIPDLFSNSDSSHSDASPSSWILDGLGNREDALTTPGAVDQTNQQRQQQQHDTFAYSAMTPVDPTFDGNSGSDWTSPIDHSRPISTPMPNVIIEQPPSVPTMNSPNYHNSCNASTTSIAHEWSQASASSNCEYASDQIRPQQIPSIQHIFENPSRNTAGGNDQYDASHYQNYHSVHHVGNMPQSAIYHQPPHHQQHQNLHPSVAFPQDTRQTTYYHLPPGHHPQSSSLADFPNTTGRYFEFPHQFNNQPPTPVQHDQNRYYHHQAVGNYVYSSAMQPTTVSAPSRNQSVIRLVYPPPGQQQQSSVNFVGQQQPATFVQPALPQQQHQQHPSVIMQGNEITMAANGKWMGMEQPAQPMPFFCKPCDRRYLTETTYHNHWLKCHVLTDFEEEEEDEGEMETNDPSLMAIIAEFTKQNPTMCQPKNQSSAMAGGPSYQLQTPNDSQQRPASSLASNNPPAAQSVGSKKCDLLTAMLESKNYPSTSNIHHAPPIGSNAHRHSSLMNHQQQQPSKAMDPRHHPSITQSSTTVSSKNMPTWPTVAPPYHPPVIIGKNLLCSPSEIQSSSTAPLPSPTFGYKNQHPWIDFDNPPTSTIGWMNQQPPEVEGKNQASSTPQVNLSGAAKRTWPALLYMVELPANKKPRIESGAVNFEEKNDGVSTTPAVVPRHEQNPTAVWHLPPRMGFGGAHSTNATSPAAILDLSTKTPLPMRCQSVAPPNSTAPSSSVQSHRQQVSVDGRAIGQKSAFQTAPTLVQLITGPQPPPAPQQMQHHQRAEAESNAASRCPTTVKAIIDARNANSIVGVNESSASTSSSNGAVEMMADGVVKNKPHLLQCHVCPKSYVLRRSLLKHIRAKHTVAPTKPAQKSLLEDVEEMEKGEYACDKCWKKFKTSRSLNHHRSTHGRAAKMAAKEAMAAALAIEDELGM